MSGNEREALAKTVAALADKAAQLIDAQDHRSAIPLLECVLGSACGNGASVLSGTAIVSATAAGGRSAAFATQHALMSASSFGYAASADAAAAAASTSVLSESDELHYIMMLANCHFRVGELDTALRGATTVQQRLFTGSSPEALALRIEAKTLAMQCCRSLSNWRQCAALADLVLAEHPQSVPALCALAACSEVTGNTDRAASLYGSALRADPFCAEAFEALTSHYLMPPDELRALIDSLEFPAGTESMRDVYQVRVAAPCPAVVGPAEEIAAPVSEPALSASVPLPRAAVLLRQANAAYAAHQLQLGLQFTTQLVQESPFHRDGLTLHLAILADLRATPKLYNVAHTLMAQRPKHALPIYAAGCYYYALSNFEKAGHFFSRAAELDPTLPHAAIALGHCYARLEEGEQALAAYRKAQTAFPALHHCVLFLGMQYSRVHSWTLAQCCLEEAKRIAPNDALVLNELGVIQFRSGRLRKALHYLQLAWAAVPRSNPSECTDCIVFNLATVLRKLREYGQALELYQLYVQLRPFAPQGHTALGLTHHILGNTKLAVGYYHAAIALKADVFCRDALERALEEEYSQGVGGAAWGGTARAASPSPSLFSTMPRARASSTATAGDVHLSPTPLPATISVGRTLTY